MTNPPSDDLKKVLVVDDDPNIFELVQLYMVAEDIEVLQAMDAYSGLDVAMRQQPDIIVLDVMMPGMSGLEMCRTLRETPPIEETQVLMLSAKAKPEDIEAGYDAGANRYVTKPFEPQELAVIIEEMMA